MSRKQMKASDVFRETDYVFSKKVSFEEAFPEIVDLNVEVKETGDKSYGRGETIRSYSMKHFPGEYIDCGNPLCYKGGFSIGGVLREMVRNKETFKEVSVFCQGYEGSPKGRRKYRSCVNFFKYKVNVHYKKEQ